MQDVVAAGHARSPFHLARKGIPARVRANDPAMIRFTGARGIASLLEQL